ncbi:cysteine--tRNA ligase [Thermostilla marina]
MIRVYNTLTRTKEPFEPVVPGKVGMYLCGPTVYKPSHIGHMVGPVIFDAIKRYLLYSGYDVTWVVNITDVDDKLIAESNRRGIPMSQVAEEMIADYMRNLEAMSIDTIDHFPRATEHIRHIIDFIQDLIYKGFAYESDGDVYFDVTKLDEYGKLSRRSLEDMIGQGGEAADKKRSPTDFALWKAAKPGEPSWESPWGPGRPGWHIECSVMSGTLLGETFDIHGGGLDLVFPHHENEIAQSEARHGKPMAKYWLHNGLMQAADEIGKVGGRRTRAADDEQAQEAGKISKSKGARPFRELLEQYAPETIRFFILSTHYRRPIEFGDRRLKEVETALDGFYRFFERFARITGKSFYDVDYAKKRTDSPAPEAGDTWLQEVADHAERFRQFMDDDFNTGGAVAELFEMLRLFNRFIDQNNLEQSATPDAITRLERGVSLFREVAATLGLFLKPVEKKKTVADDGLVGKLIELLIEVRADARKAKNFATADKIRDELKAMGVLLEDGPQGTRWRLVS